MKSFRSLFVLTAVATVACGREGAYQASTLAAPVPSTAPSATPPAIEPSPSSAAPASSPKPVATKAPSAAAAPAALSEGTLMRTLLTAAELPSGWAPASDDGSDTESGPDFEPCGKTYEEKHPPVAFAGADFENDDAIEFLSLSNDSYRSAASAVASMKDARDQIAACPTWTQTDDDGTTYTFHVTETPLANIGHETLGFEIHFDIEGKMNGQTVTAEGKGFAVGARIGQNAVGHFHAAFGFGSPPTIEKADTEALLKKAVEKFERVV